MKEKSNYRYSNPCCWCSWYEKEGASRAVCAYHNEHVNALYTCEEWAEKAEEEEGE